MLESGRDQTDMSKLRILHSADLHLDSPFEGLSAGKAAIRRGEQRELLSALAALARREQADLVLLAGDLLDSDNTYYETGEELIRCLGQIPAPVFIAPGNHDCVTDGSPWRTVEWPENVYIFRENRMTAAEVPELGVTVHGAAFTAAEQADGLLTGFTAPEGGIHIGLLHGELEPAEARYDPIRREEVAASGLAYLALGHIHKRTEPLTFGKTVCAWPGCLEGRGFDELGEKGFYQGTLSEDGAVTLTFVPFALRRYEVLEVDVTGKDPRGAVEEALPSETEKDLYRILLTGETGEGGVDDAALREALAERFYALDLRDHTRMAADIWARAGEDSLRGLFLRDLRAKWDAAGSEEERETVTRAARFGLAALDHRDLG